MEVPRIKREIYVKFSNGLAWPMPLVGAWVHSFLDDALLHANIRIILDLYVWKFITN